MTGLFKKIYENSNKKYEYIEIWLKFKFKLKIFHFVPNKNIVQFLRNDLSNYLDQNHYTISKLSKSVFFDTPIISEY